jgi:uncharacterized membrane protein
MIRRTLLFITLILIALLAGRAFWVSLLDDPARFPADVYVAYFQIVDRSIAAPIAVMGVSAMLLAGLSAALSFRDRPVLLLLCGAFCCVLLSNFVTVHYHLPINAQIASFNPSSLPAAWPGLRDRWWEYHQIRTVALLCALGFVSLAVLIRMPPPLQKAR